MKVDPQNIERACEYMLSKVGEDSGVTVTDQGSPLLDLKLTDLLELVRGHRVAVLLVHQLINMREDVFYDMGGDELQDALTDAGLFVKVMRDKPCDERAGCLCAEVGDFPLECHRITDVGKMLRDAPRPT